MDYLVNVFSLLITNLSRFFTLCKTFFQSIIDFLWNIWSILSTLWFWIKTLLNWIWSLIEYIFNWTLFDYLFNWFNDLSLYIGFGGVTFLSSIFFVILVRICIAFVFKMFRLNIDYKKMKTKRS